MWCAVGATLLFVGGRGPVLPPVGGVLQLPPLPAGPGAVRALQGQRQHQHLRRHRRDLPPGAE